MFSIENLKAELNTELLGRDIIYLSETTSTNLDAWEGGVEFRGRGGKVWTTWNKPPNSYPGVLISCNAMKNHKRCDFTLCKLGKAYNETSQTSTHDKIE